MQVKKSEPNGIVINDLTILPAFDHKGGQHEVMQVWQKDFKCLMIVDPERGEITFRESLLHLLGLDSSK
ncbi:hypothetical protein [Pseudoramibacter alactolyticus]|uniref:hypothetical protein n=1 Tax=Pseudoramibacter alactolyticus TaxID=113287 RepID=UPI00248EDD26|nr:hypothetical protein [Pseudoramibacter alactolyticus]